MPIVVICQTCQQDMNASVGCTGNYVELDGKRYARVPYGQESVLDDEPGWIAPFHCGDCYASLGALHHDGCDVERCPKCKGQFLSCDCLEDEELRSGEVWMYEKPE